MPVQWPDAIEIDRVVPASGNMTVGPQQFWLGPSRTGQYVIFWIDTTTVHLTIAGWRIKTVPPRLSAVDIARLREAGARSAGPVPAGPAPGALAATSCVEVQRLVNSSGIITLANQVIAVGSPLAGQRARIRLDGQVMHVITQDGILWRTLPCPSRPASGTSCRASAWPGRSCCRPPAWPSSGRYPAAAASRSPASASRSACPTPDRSSPSNSAAPRIEYRNRPSGPARGATSSEQSTSRSTVAAASYPATASVASSVNGAGNTDTARKTRDHTTRIPSRRPAIQAPGRRGQTQQEGNVMTQTAMEAIGQLRTVMEGPVIAPGDRGFDDGRRVWNGGIDRRPAVIAWCASATDVAAAVAYACEHGLEVSVRGGAHNPAGTAVCDGGLMIDLSLLNHVTVDPAARRATVGGGALLSDVDAATQAHGLAVPAGLVSHTGVGGLTLGGGMGWLTRKFGLSIDNLVSAEVVTADGHVRRVSASEHPDLFWAIRGGGGGNFGVVTSFEFTLHEVDLIVQAGLFFWPLDQGREALRLAREITWAMPPEINAVIGALNAPPAPFVPPEQHLAPGYVLL